MSQPEKIPERVARVEEAQTACKDKQDERHKETMGRIRRIEDRWNLLLGGIVLTLLGVIVQIAIAVLKK